MPTNSMLLVDPSEQFCAKTTYDYVKTEVLRFIYYCLQRFLYENSVVNIVSFDMICYEIQYLPDKIRNSLCKVKGALIKTLFIKGH